MKTQRFKWLLLVPPVIWLLGLVTYAARYLMEPKRRFFDYVGRGVPYGPDDGTLAPWAIAASLPLAPEIVLPALDYCIHDIKLTESNRYGFKASFNPTYPSAHGHPHGWVSPCHFGLNEGPTVLMVENYRSGLPWQLMRDCPYVVGGLRRAGFMGGWL